MISVIIYELGAIELQRTLVQNMFTLCLIHVEWEWECIQSGRGSSIQFGKAKWSFYLS